MPVLVITEVIVGHTLPYIMYLQKMHPVFIYDIFKNGVQKWSQCCFEDANGP